jgi:hypothetical protein
MKYLIFILSFLCTATSTVAQELNALVYFKDKADVATYLSNPSTMLSQRAIDRKARHNIAIDERDVPVDQEYINQLKSQPGMLSYPVQMNCAHVVGNLKI